MPNARSGLFRVAAVLLPLSIPVAACVEQDDEKPTAEDMAVAKQNILTTAPTPPLPGQRRSRRQGRLPGARRRSRPDRAGQGRHAHPLLEAGRGARRGVEDVHPPRGAEPPELHQRRPRAGKGQVPGQRRGSRETSFATSAHRAACRPDWTQAARSRSTSGCGGAPPGCRSSRARTTTRGACSPRRSR